MYIEIAPVSLQSRRGMFFLINILEIPWILQMQILKKITEPIFQTTTNSGLLNNLNDAIKSSAARGEMDHHETQWSPLARTTSCFVPLVESLQFFHGKFGIKYGRLCKILSGNVESFDYGNSFACWLIIDIFVCLWYQLSPRSVRCCSLNRWIALSITLLHCGFEVFRDTLL